MTASLLFAGIDVAKATLDIAVRPSAQTWQVIYDDAHVEALVTQLNDLSPTLIVVEATGGLERPFLPETSGVAEGGGGQGVDPDESGLGGVGHSAATSCVDA